MSEGLNLKIADFVFSILPARTIKEFSPDKNYIPFITEGKADIVLKVSKKKSPRNQGDEYSFITSPWRYYQDQKRHIYNFFYSVKKGFSERVLILEPDFKKGEIILLPYLKGPVLRNPFSYPLDELIIINLLCRKYGLLVHSCGFVYKDKGYLFIGSSGAGKSTMARILDRNRTFMSHRLTKNNKNLSPSPLIPSSFNSSPLVGEDKGGGFYYSPPIKGEEIFGLPSKVPSPLVGEGQGEGKLLDKNFSILSDDRIAVRKRHGCFYVYGTPWHGTAEFVSPEKAPLSGLFFLKKDGKLKNCASDIYLPAGANWDTLFGFYFEEDLPIKIHVYYIGKEFDLDKLSEMIYNLFADIEKDCIKINKIVYKYE